MEDMVVFVGLWWLEDMVMLCCVVSFFLIFLCLTKYHKIFEKKSFVLKSFTFENILRLKIFFNETNGA